MKMIVAVIKPFKLEAVRERLTEIGVGGLMLSEIKGFGRQSGHTEIYRGAEYEVNFVPKIRLDMVVEASMVEPIMTALRETAVTGKIGDGKVFVLDVEAALRLRTGETDRDAI